MMISLQLMIFADSGTESLSPPSLLSVLIFVFGVYQLFSSLTKQMMRQFAYGLHIFTGLACRKPWTFSFQLFQNPEVSMKLKVTSKNAFQQLPVPKELKCISHSHHFIAKAARRTSCKKVSLIARKKVLKCSSFRKIILIGWSDLFTWKGH